MRFLNPPLAFELLYGREVRGPLDVFREEWEASKRCDESVLFHILLVREKLEEMFELVSENLKGQRKIFTCLLALIGPH